jgi:hypothetical protein
MARFFRAAIMMACFLSAGSTFAAGGACPASAPVKGNNCYFIAANGSDANSGTSESSPWLHAPGMPNCAGACATVQTALGGSAPGTGFILRGGDTWHFGNSALSPYTGGTWTFNIGGNPTTCLDDRTSSGCVYYGVDPTWFTGASWTRPILNGDNPTTGFGTGKFAASCAFQTANGPFGVNQLTTTGGNRTNLYIDNFEMLGLCSQSTTGGGTSNDVYVGIGGTGTRGLGMVIEANLYIHGWSVTSNAGSSNSAIPCNILGGGQNGLQTITHLVVDGSDSNPAVCAWGGFPAFYHFKDSIIRYVTQGVGEWCHDVHDNIFEHFFNPFLPTHGNVLECNDDSHGDAPNQPQNTPNVWYNNILRHSDPSWQGSGNPQWWFCPNTIPEYWFNNLQYDIVANQNWDIAGAPTYSSCPNTGGQFMFNNTLVDVGQPCHLSGSNVTGGQFLTVLNEHLINSPYDASGCIGGPSSATNIVQTDAQATSQGYTTGSAGTNQANNCANDTATPCAPTSAGNATVGAGGNHQAYCTTLASFSSEFAIGTEAANACKFGTTDGCAYNSTTHTMVCPAHVAVARPVSTAWDAGAYQFSGSQVQAPQAPTNLQAAVQ